MSQACICGALRLLEWVYAASCRCFCNVGSLFCYRGSFVGSTRAGVILFILVELIPWVTEVFDLDDGTCLSEIEAVNFHGSNKAWELDLLESVMNEFSNRVGKVGAFRTGGKPVPIDIYGHLSSIFTARKRVLRAS